MDCAQIDNGDLFVGGAKASKDLNGLKSIGITHIVCLAGKIWFPSDFMYLKAHFPDSRESDVLLGELSTIFAFVDEALSRNGKVLIHCSGGVSRGPSVATAYLMHQRKLSLIDSLRLIKRARRGAKPNLGFLTQLLALERTLLPDNAESIKEEDLHRIFSML